MGRDAEAKLRELFLHVLKESGESRALTRTKMAKILWYSDFGAFRELGEPITGWTYIKERYGPMPDRMLQIERDLEAAGRVDIVTEGRATRYGMLDEPDLSDFTRDELAYVDKVLYLYRHAWASYLSERSHQESIGWQIAQHREAIPYQTDLLSSERLSAQEIRRGQELADQYGWR